MFLIAICFVFLVSNGESVPISDYGTLELVHVLFRHGNRTPTDDSRYPKDPYLNETYFPFGYAQLTNAGKRREFHIGTELRESYNSFLDEYYYPDIVDAWSTDVNRTKMSLQLVTAGLFPPIGVEAWKTDQKWQPVPYNYLPAGRDPVLQGGECPNFQRLYTAYSNSPRVQAEYKRHRSVFAYISKNTGVNVTSYLEVYSLFFALATEEEWGFKLPAWTKPIWPTKFEKLAALHYNVLMGTTPLRKIRAGYFLQKIIKDSQAKIEDPNSTRKLYLYSAHEVNVATVLIALDVFQLEVPTYGSYISFEIHIINKVHGVKIYYQNYSTKAPRLVKLPACDDFCPLDQFISIVEEYLPEPNECGI